MRKKAEPQTQEHPKPSRAEASKKGLIVKEQSSPRSDRETCVLDNRSHRTPRIRSAGPAQESVNGAIPSACTATGRNDGWPCVSCIRSLGVAALRTPQHQSANVLAAAQNTKTPAAIDTIPIPRR
jgi:hypothetical protein